MDKLFEYVRFFVSVLAHISDNCLAPHLHMAVPDNFLSYERIGFICLLSGTNIRPN
jgi:hypothetical protein